jgi:hypothetical protein
MVVKGADKEFWIMLVEQTDQTSHFQVRCPAVLTIKKLLIFNTVVLFTTHTDCLLWHTSSISSLEA